MAMLQDPRAQWAFLSLGFFLVAIGIPISSFGLFALLAGLTLAHGVLWHDSAFLAGTATALGHASSYFLFRFFGKKALPRIRNLWPNNARLIDRIVRILHHGHARNASCYRTRTGALKFLPFLLALRWIGGGYSQVFWALGILERPPRPWFYALVVNDFAWTFFWTYFFVFLSEKVPAVTSSLSRAGAALVGLTVVISAAAVLRVLVKTRGPVT